MRVSRLLLAVSVAIFLTLFCPLTALACMGCEMLKHPAIVLNFSPDGKALASANWLRGSKQKRGTVELWQVPKLRLWKQLPEGQGILALVFSPDGKLLAVGGLGATVSLWKLPEGRRIAQFKINKTTIWHGLGNYIRSLAFSPDGKLLAAGTRNGEIYFWQLKKGEPMCILSTNKGLGRTVISLAFSPDGKKLAAVLEEGNLFQVWQVRRGRLFWERKYNTNCFQIAFCAGGRKLVGAGSSFFSCRAVDGQVITLNSLSSFYSPPGGISLDGQWVALVHHDGIGIRVCRTAGLKRVWHSKMSGRWLKMQLHRWADSLEKRLGLPATKLFPSPIFPFAFGFAFFTGQKAVGIRI